MIQLLIIYYFPGLVLHNPIWGGGESGRFLAASFSFILNYACYFSEIYRGGIQSIPIGQTEAGLVLGMTKRQIFIKVKLLQMIKRIVNIGMHDATWRSAFGGDIYRTNGSHGCINLPFEKAKIIYDYVYTGFPVICYY